ncbi:hypothetical protein [Actinomadura latina]|uniref:Uncharacterized protein n=1 Tax=Actinomadura latina TaxID=163603 RepID=A0A846YYU7_9ACTN|nr:hypothetical protein [Actinomadura latina]NKZ03283.1 hypothetical protein [Actinomadura latina]
MNIRTLAERADRNAIDRLLTQPSVTSHLDDHTLDFLRHAQDLLFITTQTLTTVLQAEGSSGTHCCQKDEGLNPEAHPAHGSPLTPNRSVSLDAAEAWRRARQYLPDRQEDPIVLHLQEFEDGYQAIPILVSIPDPPPVPTVEAVTTLVIDKTTGLVTRWPLLPLDALAKQYRRYKRDEPMTFDIA